jgi:transaldolase
LLWLLHSAHPTEWQRESEAVLKEFANTGVDVDALAAKLQDQGADSFAKSWNDLLKVISSKSAALQTAA